MDDMFGDLEREKAQVIPISCHPEFKEHNPFNTPDDLDFPGMDLVDDEIMNMLDGPPSKPIEEGKVFGNSSCQSCTYSMDNRPAWKRLLFPGDENSYDCTFVQRTQIEDPVSGRTRYLELMSGILGQHVRIVDNPHDRCVTLNPDGRCKAFDIALAKKKQRRKRKR